MSDGSDKNRVKAQSRALDLLGIALLAVLMSGCALPTNAPSTDPGTRDFVSVAATSVAAPTPIAPAEKTSPAVPSATGQPVAKTEAPKAKAPGVPAGLPQSAKGVATAPAKNAAPPLNLKSLETRLKETNAIGVFTKIALKNQVDDLLDQFRAHYQGERKTTLAELRRPYEMLLQKVLALLQDTDPPLAGAIVASREAIWGILADPAKFAAI